MSDFKWLRDIGEGRGAIAEIERLTLELSRANWDIESLKVEYLKALAEIERLQEANKLLVENFNDNADQNMHQMVAAGEQVERLIEERNQRTLKITTLEAEVERLQSAASQAESRLCEGLEMARCALVNLDNLAPPGTLLAESPMIKIIRLQITQTIDALEGKPIDP